MGRSSALDSNKRTTPWFDTNFSTSVDLFGCPFFFSVDFPDIGRWDAIGLRRSSEKQPSLVTIIFFSAGIFIEYFAWLLGLAC